nr:ATPase [uncultured Cellulosilyticum sp.]
MENARCGEIVMLLDQLDELIEDGKTGFLSGKISVDKQQVLEIINDIRLKLPTEVYQSERILEERNKILGDAQNEARLILEEANEKLASLIDQHEITQYAREKAQNIIETAQEDARQIHMGAVDYAEDLFKSAEKQLKEALESVHQDMQNFEYDITGTLRNLYDNRQELKQMANQINEQQD